MIPRFELTKGGGEFEKLLLFVLHHFRTDIWTDFESVIEEMILFKMEPKWDPTVMPQWIQNGI